MPTTFPPVNQIKRDWIIIDADGQVLGRMATRIALRLRGKHKPSFTPFLDTGDFVVVINAEKVKLTGQKASQKQYTSYSGYPGGLKTVSLEALLRRFPDRVIHRAVKGMMPDGPLGRRMLTKLKVYAGTKHPHGSQQPQPITLWP
jgi:large subunit ribosomal protein L13